MKLIFAAAGAATVLLAGTASAQIVLPSAQQVKCIARPLRCRRRTWARPTRPYRRPQGSALQAQTSLERRRQQAFTTSRSTQADTSCQCAWYLGPRRTLRQCRCLAPNPHRRSKLISSKSFPL